MVENYGSISVLLTSPLGGNNETLIGNAIHSEKAITLHSRRVLGPLALGIILNLSRRAIDTPGRIKIGKESAILEKEVCKTAFLAHSYEIPIASPCSSNIFIPLFISPILMQYVFKNPAEATAK